MSQLVEQWDENGQIKIQQTNPGGQKGKNDAQNRSSPFNI